MFLGESVTVAKVTGLVLAVAAVLLLTEVRRARVSAGGIGWAALAMAAFGLVFLLYKVGVADGAPPPLLIFGQFCALTTIAFCWATWREGGVRFTRTIAAPLFGEVITWRKLGGLVAAILAVLAFSLRP